MKAISIHPFSRFAPRAGLVNLRQTFVCRSHGGPAGRSMMSNGTSSALNSEQDLASIPMAGGGLSRLAIARLKSAGVQVAPLLRRAGLTPEVIADPEERLSVRSQVALLDEAAIALKDDRLGFTLARDFDPRELGLLYYVMASSRTLGDAIKRVARYSQITNEALLIVYLTKDLWVAMRAYPTEASCYKVLAAWEFEHGARGACLKGTIEDDNHSSSRSRAQRRPGF